MDTITFLKKSISGLLPLKQQMGFLSQKNFLSPEELKQVVLFMKSNCENTLEIKDAIDVCGTGGSGLNRINTSTIAAFILASMGVKVAKHGNRAASGRFGSFDLLESLEVGFDVDKRIIDRTNLMFLFAPSFFPVMKYFVDVRKAIKKPTFFNILGPLLNPLNVSSQIIGTAFKDKMSLILETCKLLGKKNIFVVCGNDGLDEVTLTGETYVHELKNGEIHECTIVPEDFGVKRCDFKEIKGGDADFNKNIALEILKGECETRHQDLVLINVALALKLAGKEMDLKKAYQLVKQHLSSGIVFDFFEKYRLLSNAEGVMFDILDEKTKKGMICSKRDFYSAIKKEGRSLIAEIKIASPSEDQLIPKGKSYKKIAKLYEQNGARAISVVCENKFFKGSLNILEQVAQSTKIPILCKDFIIHEFQIYEARKAGADAILLIASYLSKNQIDCFLKVAEKSKMDVLCEIHNEKELKKALQTSVKIIGINNRDLKNFKIDLNTTNRLSEKIPKKYLIVSESGIHSKSDVEQLSENVNGVLVGTSLLKSVDLKRKTRELSGRKYLKVCGIRTMKAAEYCESSGVDFIGLNFVPTSSRKISIEKAKQICEKVVDLKVVGVFQNQSIEEVNKIAKSIGLDYVQLAGNEGVEFIKRCKSPVIKTIPLVTKADLKKAKKAMAYVEFVIFDGPKPGSGISPNFGLLKGFKEDFFIAGGVNSKNISKLNRDFVPSGFDLASGVETDGEVDCSKIKKIINHLSL